MCLERSFVECRGSWVIEVCEAKGTDPVARSDHGAWNAGFHVFKLGVNVLVASISGQRRHLQWNGCDECAFQNCEVPLVHVRVGKWRLLLYMGIGLREAAFGCHGVRGACMVWKFLFLLLISTYEYCRSRCNGCANAPAVHFFSTLALFILLPNTLWKSLEVEVANHNGMAG